MTKSTIHYSHEEKYEALRNVGLSEFEAVQIARAVDMLTFAQIKEVARVLQELAKGK